MHGPALVIDKSTLQSLSDRESWWLFHFFHVVLTPTLFLEIRADLAKAARSGKEPEEEVSIIAKKIHSFSTSINIDHLELCIGDLLGYQVEMNGVPVVGGAKNSTMAQAKQGYTSMNQKKLNHCVNGVTEIFLIAIGSMLGTGAICLKILIWKKFKTCSM